MSRRSSATWILLGSGTSGAAGIVSLQVEMGPGVGCRLGLLLHAENRAARRSRRELGNGIGGDWRIDEEAPIGEEGLPLLGSADQLDGLRIMLDPGAVTRQEDEELAARAGHTREF